MRRSPSLRIRSARSPGVHLHPTLTMAEGTAAANSVADAYRTGRHHLAALRDVGAPILAGTDANTQPGAPSQVPHAESRACTTK